MVTVCTKEGLQQALKNRESQIRVTGELAKSMRKKSKIKKGAKIGGVLMIIGGIVSIPFTGGASAGVSVYGLTAAATATAITAGSISITATELAILCGFVLGMAGILMGAKVEFHPDGTVTITPRYKS